MRTIEEAAKEFRHDELINPTLSQLAFKAGVEFAQRWISVEEELPPVGELVQVEYCEFVGDKSIKYDHDMVIEPEKDIKFFSMEQCAVKVIGWRPIELK